MVKFLCYTRISRSSKSSKVGQESKENSDWANSRKNLSSGLEKVFKEEKILPTQVEMFQVVPLTKLKGERLYQERSIRK